LPVRLLPRYDGVPVRVLLLIVLVNGLVPAMGEAVESVSHYARTGHVAHGAEDAGAPCESSREHGCSDTEHHCTCCAGMPVLSLPRAMAAAPTESAAGAPPAALGNPNARALEPPYRPPIA
jgi:hypothetical protein